MRFNSAHYRGQIIKRAVVETNDPRQTEVPLILKAYVTREVQLEPMQLRWQALPAGQLSQTRLRLTNHGDQPLQLLELTSTSPAVRLQAQDGLDQVAPGETLDLLVQVEAGPAEGLLHALLAVEVAGVQQRCLRVPLHARVVVPEPEPEPEEVPEPMAESATSAPAPPVTTAEPPETPAVGASGL